MPVPGQTLPMPAEFSEFAFPSPPTRPGHIVLNRFFLYETKTRFFIVGTNAPAGTRFRVLKIDRTTAPDELNITEDEAVYSKSEVDDLLEMIANGNKSTGGMREIAKFYGIVGFVRFTEGYYLTIITRRSSVALIGGHYIFHIDATSTISIHSSTTPTSKLDKNSDEARYLQMYQMVDLTKNFYFSYSYDITRTLQANMTRLRTFPSTPVKSSPAMSSSTWPSAVTNPSSSSTTVAASTEVDAEAEEEADLDASELESGRNKMFVWNQYLLENGFGEHSAINNQWALPIMYGFVDQSKLSILGRNVFVTLIARRSRLFAGARFLKRGVNDRGYVANDVETEQIVSEMSTTSFYGAGTLEANPNHTSFVQHRGSIPLFWTQDGTNMSPKPPIELNVVDPYFTAAALHFDDMFKRYGAPCIVLNLIKAKEKTARESILLKEFTECIDYLNQFLPEDKKIQHIKWDMSRASKSPNENVISVLEIIAEKTFAQTGFFHTGYNQQHKSTKDDHSGNVIYGSGLQNGVVRTNCIDCLDRTNAAQFIIAKCALGHQLFSLGLISEPIVPFDCDVVNMLTEMYHDHGDTIALQYGGSHLVNTMETYRKINQWTSHSRDMLESIRRFYSNSFVDAEKQDAMNLFLGNYVVHKGQPALWELPGDYHLHNITDPELKKIRKSYTKWFTPDAILPQADLIRKRLQEYEELEQRQFLLHDAGYDEYEGDGRYGDDDGDNDESRTFAEGIPHHDSNDHDSGTRRSSDQHDPSLRHFDRRVVGDHIEHLRSDDEDEYGSTGHPTPFTKAGRVQSIDSIHSAHSSASLSEQGHRKSSIASSSMQSSMNSIHTHRTQNSNTSPSPGSDAASLLPKEANTEVKSTKSRQASSVDESLLDFKDRIVAPLSPVTNSESQDARKTSLVPASSSSSISSSIRKYPHHRKLHHRSSRSSMTTTSSLGGGQPRSSVHFSKAHDFFADSWDACEVGEDGAGKNTSWDEYWDEYYRPKVQTSFQRLVKKSAEQSPFEVRQNQGILSQAELNAKAAAKSEKPSMLSWLGLTGGNSNPASGKGRNGSSSTKSGASSAGYANGSKTLPLSTGRKKGFLSSLADPENDSSNTRQYKDGVTHHSRGSRLSVASFPVTSTAASTIADLDERVSISGSSFTTNRTMVPDEKVRLPPHIPRSKEEEFELTKNVSTNIAQFAIHDSAFVPSALSPEQTQAQAESGKKGTRDLTTASGGHGEGTTKGRSGIEDLVKKSLTPEVTSQESKEYKRYTQQFKSIRFDSVPTKGAASYSTNAHASQKSDWPTHSAPHTATATPLYGSVANGLSNLQQHGDHRSKQQRSTISASSSGSNIRPGLAGSQLQGGSSISTATIGTVLMDLTEDEEFFYSTARKVSNGISSSTPGERSKVQISTARSEREAIAGSGTFSATMSPLSPVVVSPLSPNGAVHPSAMPDIQSVIAPGVTQTSSVATQDSVDNASQPQDDIVVGNEPTQLPPLTSVNNRVNGLDYLPDPPILLAPIQTVIKAPTETEMYLYNAHVELPKITLYTVGQTSLNPYWGSSTGTRARYDAYQGWIQKGRYGNATVSSAAQNQAQAIAAAAALNGTNGVGGAHGDSGGGPGQVNAGASQHALRRGSSGAVVYQSLGEMAAAQGGQGNGSYYGANGRDRQQQLANGGSQQHQQPQQGLRLKDGGNGSNGKVNDRLVQQQQKSKQGPSIGLGLGL
ncbi:phosphatidylinositol-3,5-bisphosphate 5-phosphatase [Podila minutissima]|nr:phosphatidylinositol-3,5-bisphosphate 5-phosphatase [Podila minutissima]